MIEFLAKSDNETIVEHTKELLKNYEILKNLYPRINVNWELLEIACLYHDLGKMNSKFQKKINENRLTIEGELPHGLLSISLLPVKELLAVGKTKEEIRILAYAIALHHERDMSQITDKDFEEEILDLAIVSRDFPFQLLGISKKIPKKISKRYFKLNTSLRSATVDNYDDYLMLKGLLNRIDFAASGHLAVEHPNDFLESSMSQLEYNWNDLQKYMLCNQQNNVIVIAQTGLGKTEAGLLWLGGDKGFFTLPLKTAINAIYERLVTKIVKTKQTNRVGLLHSDSYQQYRLLKGEISYEGNIEEYVNKTRQLSLPLTICTLDQLFDIVFRYPGYEHKLATLSYSKVIIDEIQMYSADLLAYVIYGLDLITQYGGKFAILTATLPPYVLDLIQAQGLEFKQPDKPYIDEKLSYRHQIAVIQEAITSQAIIPYCHDNKVLVICNTVKQAKRLYQELVTEFGDGEVNLLHSQFIKRDRRAKEQAIYYAGQLTNGEKSIWVTTQVVEASLDIDFDFLFTELSDLSGLFQRMGRCYRKRPWSESVGTNVYVFDGGKKQTSGVGFVVDKEIFSLAKTALREATPKMDELTKMYLIEKTYTTAKVSDTGFYKEVKNNLSYLSLLAEGQVNKQTVLKTFRNINSYTVIPAPIYLENKEIIDLIIEKMKQSTKGLSKEGRDELRTGEKNAREQLSDYQVDVPGYAVEMSQMDQVEINQYEVINIFDCDYSSAEGLTYLKPEKESLIF